MEYKMCTKCKELKPATTRYFYTGKSNKGGLKTICKLCLNKSRKELRHERNSIKDKQHRIIVYYKYQSQNKELGECWIYKNYLPDSYNYPSIRFDGKSFRLSRFIYEHFKGAIPPCYVVRHKCDCRSCINPDHLEMGTVEQNNKDTAKRGRHRNQRAECLDYDTKGVIQNTEYHAIVLD